MLPCEKLKLLAGLFIGTAQSIDAVIYSFSPDWLTIIGEILLQE